MTDNTAGDDFLRSEAVLVVGGGISGMQSALLLAEAGYKAYLLDSAPGIGGSMHLLDRTFPTDSCGLCLMLPGRAAYCPTIECDLHRNIEILPYAEVLDVAGEPGDLTVTVRHKPRYVHVDRCTNCGLCAQVCPVERPDRYEGDLHKGKAIYRPPTRAIPPSYVIDMDYCTRCGKCVEICPTEAIDLGMEAGRSEVTVGAVILSPGFEPFDARLKGQYGFGHYDNVLNSLQFERMVSLSGSTGASIVRPSDGEVPQRVAFIQCVGSRDESIGKGYCSSVCCMYTAKQVAVAKRIQPDLDVTVFFMDIRAHGKDFDEYYDEVASLPGVVYRRCMVSSLHQVQQTRNLQLIYVAEDGGLQEEEFDLVVLSVGFAPPVGFQRLGRALGVDLSRYGFCVTDTFTPSESSRPGILVSGAFREPKDIPETVMEASAVAARAARDLRCGQVAEVATTNGESEEMDRGLDYEFQAPATGADAELEAWPRIGVFLCDCRGEVGGAIDLEAVAAHAQDFRDVALARVIDNACLAGGLEQLGQAIREHELNRVVVAGCTGRLYQSAFERMMGEAGLNPGLLERVNLLGECVWVHQGNGSGQAHGVTSTDKARELVEMAVASARLRKSLSPAVERVAQRGLVIGGGLAGMTAALSLAEMGYEVDLVERSGQLGGQLLKLWYTLEDVGHEAREAGSEEAGDGGLVWGDPQSFLKGLVERVERNERVHVYKEAQVETISGIVGQYEVTLALSGGQKEMLKDGAVIVATGGHEVVPAEYLYGQDPRVVTQRELEERIQSPEFQAPKSVVMIQCVGSREPERPYCSRVCCSKAVANALKIKERDPRTNVFVLYREMRTYGFRELYYREARDQGVIFLRYELPDKPQVSAGEGGLTVRFKGALAGEEVTLGADMLVLSTGIEPNETHALAEALGVPLDKNGFFQEEYPKMRPLDFARSGMFMCGLAHSPRSSSETIVQAQGAAMRAATVLAKQALRSQPTVVQVTPKRCSACGLCVDVCPFGARVLEPGWPYAEVIEVLCQGCGVCVAACPNKACQQTGIEVGQVYGMLDAVGW